VIADAGLAQFRCAETEKNPHVTFFFNNYRGEPFPGEDRACPPSPKVATYDQQPEMSSVEVTRLAREAILSGKYALLVVNFANPDMVGHTGNLAAAIQAVQATDKGVGILLEALAQMHGKALICADHGNCEQMWDPIHNVPHTSHTLNLVEAFVVGEDYGGGKIKLREGGRLGDIAPTLLAMIGLPQPAEMTGKSLIAK
jgi:2,3-bisphosphoglycerate-independent phosphoglycerate mutase